MTEADFRLSLQKGLQSQGCWVHKISDLARAQIKPCDLIVGYAGCLWLVECKLTKFQRKKSLSPTDVILKPSDFRSHQLPTLQEVMSKRQASGYVAFCVADIALCGKVNKRAWMIAANTSLFNPPREVRLGELEECWQHRELQWVPSVGWTAPWLSRGKL